MPQAVPQYQKLVLVIVHKALPFNSMVYDFRHLYISTKNSIFFFVLSFLFHLFIFSIFPSKLSIANSKSPKELSVNIESLSNLTDISPTLLRNDQIIVPKELVRKDEVTKTIKNKTQNSSLLPLEEPRYYRFEELDAKPTVVEDIDTNAKSLSKYPDGGSLTLQLWIDEMGSVIRIKIIETDLPQEFSNKAKFEFFKVKFSPALKNNQFVKSTAKITVKYNPIINN